MTTYTAVALDHGASEASYIALPMASGIAYIAGEQDPDGDTGVGLLTVNAAPGAREIEVRHRRTRVVVGRTWSAPDGTYRIGGLNPAEEYDVIARDHTGVYEDCIVGAQLPYLPA